MPPGCETDDWSLKTPAKSDVGLKTRLQRGYALGFESELVDLLDRLKHVGQPVGYLARHGRMSSATIVGFPFRTLLEHGF